MSRWRVVENTRTGQVALARARLCAGFFCRLRGLLQRTCLAENEGAIFVVSKASRALAAVHTIGMRFSIGIIWLDERGIVVDKAVAKPWRFCILPKSPATCYIESSPCLLDRACMGDTLVFDKEPS